LPKRQIRDSSVSLVSISCIFPSRDASARRPCVTAFGYSSQLRRPTQPGDVRARADVCTVPMLLVLTDIIGYDQLKFCWIYTPKWGSWVAHATWQWISLSRWMTMTTWC